MINDQYISLQYMNKFFIYNNNEIFIIEDVLLKLSLSKVQYIFNINKN